MMRPYMFYYIFPFPNTCATADILAVEIYSLAIRRPSLYRCEILEIEFDPTSPRRPSPIFYHINILVRRVIRSEVVNASAPDSLAIEAVLSSLTA